jgi:hypothetical protein
MFNSVIAKRDARGKCRLDNTARLFSRYLSASSLPGVEGLRCLEIGTGYVGATPVIMWLLGAAQATSVDLNPLLALDALRESIRLTDRVGLFNVLKPHVTSAQALEARLLRLYAWLDSPQRTPPDGIAYIAPFDVLTCAFGSQFNLIFSVSTLEHIPPTIVPSFLGKLASLLAEGGVSLHAIDLTDHFDSAFNPLGFLSIQTADYCGDSNADSRGNRIRGSEWLRLFAASGLKSRIVWSESAASSHLPERLASPFDRMDPQDLLLTSVLIRGDRA